MSELLENKRTAIADKVRVVGEALTRSLRPVLGRIPGSPTRPNQLSRELGINRATSSKLLIALNKTDPLEVVHAIPGPEPLRSFLDAAASKAVEKKVIAEGKLAIDAFESLIRNDAGTRSALDSIISSNLPEAREKFELASKYSIFKGMSQLKGVRAETWLGSAILTPAKTDSERHDLTWLTGAFGIQRLRSNVTVSFSYRTIDPAQQEARAEAEQSSISVLPMEEFCTNPPAQVEAKIAGEMVHYTLPDTSVGPRFPSDMLVVDDHPAAMKRFAKPGKPKHSALFVEPAFPVTLLVFDLLLHEDAFPGAQPELVIYDTGTKGIANVNDPERDIDRMQMQENLEFTGKGLESLRCQEIPRYGEMLAKLSDHFEWDPGAYRCFRCKIQYPVYGWQFSIAFEPPEK